MSKLSVEIDALEGDAKSLVERVIAAIKAKLAPEHHAAVDAALEEPKIVPPPVPEAHPETPNQSGNLPKVNAPEQAPGAEATGTGTEETAAQ